MARFPTYEEMGKKVAEKALDEITYEGKTIREWVEIIVKQQPCEDCINRTELLSRIDAEREYLLYLKMDGAEHSVVHHARRIIEDMPSVTPKARWIPVSERLPETNGRYVVTRGLNACGALWNRVYIVNYSDLMGLKSERIWWDGNVGKSDFKRIDDVIAWMPLPESYKEENNETDN